MGGRGKKTRIMSKENYDGRRVRSVPAALTARPGFESNRKTFICGPYCARDLSPVARRRPSSPVAPPVAGPRPLRERVDRTLRTVIVCPRNTFFFFYYLLFIYLFCFVVFFFINTRLYGGRA